MRPAAKPLLALALLVALPLAGCLTPTSPCFVLRPDKPDCSYRYQGVDAVAPFDGPFDAAAAREALRSAGLAPDEDAERRGLTASLAPAGSVFVGESDSGGWVFSVAFASPHVKGISRGEVDDLAAAQRRLAEPAFGAALAAFEDAIGVRRSGNVTWSPNFAVA